MLYGWENRDRQAFATAGEGVRVRTQDPSHKQGHYMAGGTETMLLSSAIVTLLTGPGGLKWLLCEPPAEKAMSRVVKVVTEPHFLRTELRPAVLGRPQAPLTFDQLRGTITRTPMRNRSTPAGRSLSLTLRPKPERRRRTDVSTSKLHTLQNAKCFQWVAKSHSYIKRYSKSTRN